MNADARQVIVAIEERAQGHVATVTLVNPGKLNALNAALMGEFVEAVDRLAEDANLRAMVLTGAGERAFVGGADITEMAALDGPPAARAFISRVHACCAAVRALPVPVIARIQNCCFGAGLELAASCDLRLAAETAVFGMPEVRLGIPSVVEAALLPGLVGWGRARQILLFGETFDARQALAWGLIEEVVAPAALNGGGRVVAGSHLLAPCAPGAAPGGARSLIRAWKTFPLKGAIDAGVDAFTAAFETNEPAIGMAAFLAAQRTARLALSRRVRPRDLPSTLPSTMSPSYRKTEFSMSDSQRRATGAAALVICRASRDRRQGDAAHSAPHRAHGPTDPGQFRWRSPYCVLLGATVAGLTVPHLCGGSINQVQALLAAATAAHHAHMAAAQQTLLEGRSVHALWVAAGLIVAASTIQGVLTGFGAYQGERVSQRVAYHLRLDYFRQLQRLSFAFHDKIHSGDLITRGMIDLEGTRMFIQNGMMQSLTLVLMLAVATGMMFHADPIMAVLALTFVPISVFTLVRVGFMLRVAWMRVQTLMSVLTLTMEENLQGIRVVRAFAARAFEMAKFDKAASEALREAYQRILLRMRAVRTTTLTFYFSNALVLWYGGHRVAEGAMTAGRLTEFILYLNILQAPVRQVIMIVMSAARATTCGGRLFEILDIQPTIADRPGAVDLVARQGPTAIRGMSTSPMTPASRSCTTSASR